jgi:hypothetical protein
LSRYEQNAEGLLRRTQLELGRLLNRQIGPVLEADTSMSEAVFDREVAIQPSSRKSPHERGDPMNS